LCRPDLKIIAEASLRDRRIDIPYAAARHFGDQSFAAMSLDRVSDQIGSAGGAIYCYYRSKPDLFPAVYRGAMELAQGAVRPPRESDGKVLERLHGTALARAVLVMEQLLYLRVAKQELETHVLERTNEGERTEIAEVGTLREPNGPLCIRIIKRGITSGESRPVNLRLLAKSLLGVLNRTLRWYHTDEGESGAARMAESIGEFVGGLA
jgi:AcrR family transcriptional regulator